MPRKFTLVLCGAALACALMLLLYHSSADGEKSVIVYSSVDAEFALPLFELFTKETGIAVVPRLDGEETKTTGLAQRLEQMKGHPDGDVFWNSESSFTQLLASRGVLEPYVSPQAQEIPAEYKDAAGLWAGFGCRARVVIFNTNQVKPADAPRTLEDFADPKWKGRCAVAKPLYGTTRSHFTAIFLQLGEARALTLFRKWRENGVIVAESNGDVRDRVADGTALVGITDSDDAYAALDRKKPVDFFVLDQAPPEWPGAFLIPNTVSMLKGCPHPKSARRFIDWLLRPETENWLAENDSRQIPVRAGSVKLPPALARMNLKPAAYDAKKCAENVLPLGERIYRILSGEER